MKILTTKFINSPSEIKPSPKVVDCFDEQVKELFFIRNPQFRFNKYSDQEFIEFKKRTPSGLWHYFPWLNTAVHLLPESEFFELRTARNKNLITQNEQETFYNSTIAFAGLSVGSHAAITIAMTGGAKRFKIADPDTISISNLNRLRYGVQALGSAKVLVAAQTILEINPYATIYIYEEGITKENLSNFIAGDNLSPKCDILVEGVDNLAIKIFLRQEAKKQKIPVIMATDNGDGIILDVERYDISPNLQLFNGALDNFSINDFESFSPQELPKLATKVAGPEYIVTRMLESLTEVGKTLYSWPQLGTAASFTGVVSAFIARAILTKQNIESGKYNINLNELLNAGFKEFNLREQDNLKRNSILKLMGL